MEEFGHGGAALVECWLETGRTHQIRVHMAYVGHGLVGDQTYGGKKRLSPRIFGEVADLGNEFPRQALHAATLGFDHPVTGERLEFNADLPPDMAAVCWPPFAPCNVRSRTITGCDRCYTALLQRRKKGHVSFTDQ